MGLLAERQRVLAMVAGSGAGFDLHQQRQGMDALAEAFPVASDVSIAADTIGGVEGEWISAGQFQSDAAILYVHGGGFCVGSAKAYRHVTSPIARHARIRVFTPNYRLAPENPYPAGVEDVVAAFEALARVSGGARRVALAGDSGGGGLMLSSLLEIRNRGLASPACAAAICPWADLTQTSPTYESPATNDPLVSRHLNNTLASLYLPHGDARDPDVSAAFADYQGLPPLLIQTSGMEALRGDAEMVRERALAANVEVNFESWAHMIHVWHLFNPILREGRDALQSVANFLVRHLD